MTLSRMSYHEYMPSRDSMAAQMYDLKKVIKQKYSRISRDHSVYPFKLLQPENAPEDLKSLLSLYTNDVLKNIVDALKADIPRNVNKDVLIRELSKEIINSFEKFLGTMNDSMYHLLLKFRDVSQIPLSKVNAQASSVNYLLQRGYLFRCLSQEDEVLLMPEELLHILNRLDEAETNRNVKRNTAICKIGRRILYYYGVMDDYHFYMYLNTQFDNFEKGRLDVKINLSRLSYSDYYRKKDINQNADKIFKNYAQYAKEVNEVCFNDNYHRLFFCYYSVFDPYNIYFEQQQREDLDFLPLCCNELMTERLSDAKAKDAMREYLIKHLRLDPFKAHMLVEEWGCYVKNGENPGIYIDNILEYLDFKAADQVNEMLSFSSVYFMNELNQWRIKGHTPNELMGIKLEERRKQAAYQKTAAESKDMGGKTARNDPCPCGSGKKYKKCCGK